MPPIDRTPWRDTFIYESSNRARILGGLWTAKGVTNANLYSMLEIFCVFTDTFELHDRDELLVERDSQQLQPGKYYIVTSGSITLTKETPLTRTISFASGTRVESFRNAVRERDQGCVLTSTRALLAHLGCWDTFEATHIFPLAYEKHWIDQNYSDWITVPPSNESDGSINSVQNGILLRTDIQALFVGYKLAINPDDNYKIMCFSPDTAPYDIAGHQVDQAFLDDPHRPVDGLLRWHFRQAVLTNMKGAGEPCFETDFPRGSDIMSGVMNGPKAAERMEFELFSRFNAMEFCA